MPTNFHPHTQRSSLLPISAQPTLGPRMNTLIASCVLVLTSRALGLTWLEQPILALPSGLWAIGLAMLIAQYRHQRKLELSEGADAGVLSTRLSVPQISVSKLKERLPSSEHMTGMMEMIGVPAASWQTARKKLYELGSRIAPGTVAHTNTIRIGVDLCDAEALALIAAGKAEDAIVGGAPAIEWVRSRAGLISDVERDLAAEGLDALVRRERRGDINIFVPEHPSRPAAWYDWSTPMPLGYASVFPPRLDTARIAIAHGHFDEQETARATAQLILASAMLGRTSMRVGSGSWISGRTAVPELMSAGGPLDRLVIRMGSSLIEGQPSDGRPLSAPTRAVLKTTARVVGAWLTQSGSSCEDDERVALARAAAKALYDEPEALLRSAAMEFAAGQTDAGLKTLASACQQLRHQGRRCESDPLAFIMSEVELGSPGRVTLGRIASGIGLLWATSAVSNHAYLRDDLMDDLSHAGWLSRRPADVQLLQRVVEMLQREAPAAEQSKALAA